MLRLFLLTKWFLLEASFFFCSSLPCGLYSGDKKFCPWMCCVAERTYFHFIELRSSCVDYLKPIWEVSQNIFLTHFLNLYQIDKPWGLFSLSGSTDRTKYPIGQPCTYCFCGVAAPVWGGFLATLVWDLTTVLDIPTPPLTFQPLCLGLKILMWALWICKLYPCSWAPLHHSS